MECRLQRVRFAAGSQVFHARLGLGTVKAAPEGGTVIVRFDAGLEECRIEELEARSAVPERVAAGVLDDGEALLARGQAEAIRSVNQTWGVFAPSRIQLLPHQLWVCKRVLERWPVRWLVADDVGLGKTVEAGLILWPLIARGAVNRLLVLCPASLVGQWQQRMREMFDIRLLEYTTELDSDTSEFWNSNPRVVASLQTLRGLRNDAAKERRERLLAAAPWDLVIVDEAHHLNVEESTGETQGYQLLRALDEAGRVVSLLLFSATPHRGKHEGFWALLRLLRSDIFGADKPTAALYPRLREAMIRNNKERVTDLNGVRLFQRPSVHLIDYSYSADEHAFYEKLTQFIVEGRAYASTLGGAAQSVGLVLTALQKLAASSVAAIRAALRRRVERLESRLDQRPDGSRARQDRAVPEIDDSASLDLLPAVDEELVASSLEFALLRDELPVLQELLRAANLVVVESKLVKLLTLLDETLTGRSVLFFTEYKATQGLVVAALRKRFGPNSVTFINGDGELSVTEHAESSPVVLRERRKDAAAAFNSGRARFLVSTEAGGEGIDLQESCHTIVHLDLPWNPMRIHQRNGRLYRYGQQHRVEIYTLRNPATVESKIWDLLTEKMHEIERALVEVTDDPEDLMGIVLGATPARQFERLFEHAHARQPETLANWFRAESATFGGRELVETVRDIFGNVARFDFQAAAAQIPRVDLADLESFMRRSMALLGRRFVKQPDGSYSLVAPEKWFGRAGIRRRYDSLSFSRDAPDASTVLSAGHRLVLEAIEWACALDAAVAMVSGTPSPIILVKLRDRVTTTSAQLPAVVVGVVVDAASQLPAELLQDWQTLQMLNKMSASKTGAPSTVPPPEQLAVLANACVRWVEERVGGLDLPFDIPVAEVLLALWPE